jgi:hypothetical protein
MAKDDEKNGSNGNVVELKKKAKDPKPPAELTRFWEAPEVEQIATVLITQGRLPHMSVLRQARILYLFTNAERIAGENVMQAQRFNAKYAYREDLQHDFILTISKPQWDRTPPDLQSAVIYHGLLHFDSDTTGRWRIAPHDFEGFISELEQFPTATWQEGLRKARQLGLFDNVASAELADAGREVVLTK